MIIWLNNPLEDVIQATINLYGDISCNIQFNPELYKEKVYGVTQFCNDGSVIIELDATLPYINLLEILTHELAHVITKDMEEDEHGEKWNKVCDDIHQEYHRYCEDKYCK